MKAIGSMFGGGATGPSAEAKAKQDEVLALQKENARKLAAQEKKQKDEADSRQRLVRAMQGHGGNETLYASATGVTGQKSKVVG